MSLRYLAAINITNVINSHQTSDAKFMIAALKMVVTLKSFLLVVQQEGRNFFF